MKYTTIISDLGNVIMPFDYTRFHAEVAKDAGVSVEAVKAVLWDPGHYVPFEKGQITPEAFLGILQRKFRVTLPYGKLVDLFCDIFSINQGVVEMWRTAKARHRLLLLSNTNVLHIDYLKPRETFWPLFDHLVLSYEVGYVKPQEEIFKDALKHARAQPEECIFVDDILKYVEAANAVGIKGIQFQSEAQLRTDLTKLGIL